MCPDFSLSIVLALLQISAALMQPAPSHPVASHHTQSPCAAPAGEGVVAKAAQKMVNEAAQGALSTEITRFPLGSTTAWLICLRGKGNSAQARLCAKGLVLQPVSLCSSLQDVQQQQQRGQLTRSSAQQMQNFPTTQSSFCFLNFCKTKTKTLQQETRVASRSELPGQDKHQVHRRKPAVGKQGQSYTLRNIRPAKPKHSNCMGNCLLALEILTISPYNN